MRKVEITIDGDEVRFHHPTDWERRTLMANGFKRDPKQEFVMVSSKPGADEVAKIVLQGGLG